jgi:hypothetical protein
VLAPPVAAGSSPDQPEFSRHGLRDSERLTPARSNEPHGDRSTAGSHSRAAQDLRPVASLVVVAASHSSAACGQHVPLSAARTCRGCESRAPNEPPFEGQRGVVGQSRPDAVHAPTSEWLESVVSPRLQNRELLQQGFPYPVGRSIAEKVSLYYAGLSKSTPQDSRLRPNATVESLCMPARLIVLVSINLLLSAPLDNQQEGYILPLDPQGECVLWRTNPVISFKALWTCSF